MCDNKDSFTFHKKHEHFEDNEYDDVWICDNCKTIHGFKFFEFRVSDLEKAQQIHDNKAAKSFANAVN
jgi:hypothetical protein